MPTQKELDIIRDTFGDNEKLLKAMRNLALGVDTTDEEKQLIKGVFANVDLYEAVRKRLNPQLSDFSSFAFSHHPWGQIAKMTLGANKEQIAQIVNAKTKVEEWTNKALSLFQEPNGKAIELPVEMSTTDEYQVELIALDMYVSHITEQINVLNAIAGTESNSPEEVKEKMEQDSTE